MALTSQQTSDLQFLANALYDQAQELDATLANDPQNLDVHNPVEVFELLTWYRSASHLWGLTMYAIERINSITDDL